MHLPPATAAQQSYPPKYQKLCPINSTLTWETWNEVSCYITYVSINLLTAAKVVDSVKGTVLTRFCFIYNNTYVQNQHVSVATYSSSSRQVNSSTRVSHIDRTGTGPNTHWRWIVGLSRWGTRGRNQIIVVLMSRTIIAFRTSHLLVFYLWTINKTTYNYLQENKFDN